MNNRRLYRNGGPIGPLATITCESRQARKGATVTGDSCAGVWLVGSPPCDPPYAIGYRLAIFKS